jgi:bacterial/archaeal transporter family protein
VNSWLTWSLLSAVFAGATAVLAKIGVTGVDSNFATAIRTTVILLFTWLIASFTRSDWSFETISRRTWFFLALSGLATGLSWLCYFRALQLGEASRVAPMDKLSVLFAILLAAIVLRETLTWHHLVGGGLVLAGAIVLAFKST